MKIITGMHRSGTSLAANLLHHLGVPLNTSSLIPTDSWNSAGYYENLDLVILNDRMILGNCPGLAKFRRTPSGSRPLWLTVWISFYKLQYLFLNMYLPINRRAKLLKDEIISFTSQNQGALLKDPRFSLTIQFWHEYSRIDGVLYSYRHPLEVAKSLNRRDKLPVWLGLRLWAFHVESFLEQKGNLQVTYINFNNFFKNDLAIKEVKRCYNFAGQPYNAQKAECLLGKGLKKSLKRQRTTESSMSPRYYELFARLEKLHL